MPVRRSFVCLFALWLLCVASAGAVNATDPQAEAAYQRGQTAYQGRGQAVDKALAAREYAQAAQAGHARAQYNLGRMLWSGDGVSRDVPGALGWMQRAADAGEANAQFVLAQAYESGLGVPKDAALGLQWLERAAAGGEPLAQRELGQRLIDGRGVSADPVRGRALIAAAGAGAAPAATGERAQVLAALRKLLQAQGRGDLAVMRSALATDGLDAEQQRELDAALRRGAGLRFRVILVEPEATGIQGEWALLRYRYQIEIETGSAPVAQAGGNLALLQRTTQGWKVHRIVVDEALTLATHLSVAVPTLTQQPATAHDRVCQTPIRPPGLIEAEEFRELANSAIDSWQVDEGKLTRDAVFSAFGKLTHVGDFISNSYTAYERLRTLGVELPADVFAGNVEATLLDISLMTWGGVQFIAEPFPYADHLTDLAESALENVRYNAVQRFNYLELLKRLKHQDFKALPHFLFLRPSSQAQFDLARRALHLRTAAEWHGRWPALRAIDVLSDAFLRSDPLLRFSIGAELAIRKSENETHYELARALGLRSATAGGDDMVAYVPLDLTLVASTRKAVRAPRTEEERRAARDSLGLTGTAGPPLGEQSSLRIRISGGLVHLWVPEEALWSLFGSASTSGAGSRMRLDLSGGNADGQLVSGRLDGDPRTLAGELQISEGGEVDRYRAQLRR